MSAGCQHRRPRLRRGGGVADLRLDGRGQGGARIGLAVPGPGPRPERDPGQPRLGRPAGHRGRARDSRLREPGRAVARAGPAGLGRGRPRPGGGRDLLSLLRSGPGDQWRDPSRRRRVSRHRRAGDIAGASRGQRYRPGVRSSPHVRCSRWSAGSPPSATCGSAPCWARWRSRSPASSCASATPRRRPRRSSAASTPCRCCG